MWKFLYTHGATVIGVITFLLLLSAMIVLTSGPWEIIVTPKLLPLLKPKKDEEKKPLKIREFGPGLWATGGTPEDEQKKNNGVIHTKKPEYIEEKK